MTRVLLVEDSPTQAQHMTWLLEEQGYVVTTVGDAETGFQRLAQQQFDVVVTDLMLPGASGFDLCRQVKGHREWQHTPVVVLTSQADPVNVLRGLEAGADGFMTKDCPPEEIVGRLRRLVSRPARPAGVARVVFLDCEFEIAADREQLLNVLLAAFEDMVHLNHQYQGSLDQLRQLNRQLQDTVSSEQQALAHLKQAQSQLVHVEKLSSLGQMVAGIAHEINNPLAMITSNLAVLERDIGAVRDLVKLYQEGDAVLAKHAPELTQRIEAFREQIDLSYTMPNLEGVLIRSGEGCRRIQQIIKGLREFARLDSSRWKTCDINEGINFNLGLFKGKSEAQGVRLMSDLKPLPLIHCQPANLNQVFFNLIANAEEACTIGQQVMVRSRPVHDGIEVQVADTGRGIATDIRDKIFDPFFTTKPPGSGPGLGLSICYSIIKDHGGHISFESVPKQGSTFTVFLPKKTPGPQ